MQETSRISDILHKLDDVIEQGIQEKAFPGAALWVGWRGETLKCSAYGDTADKAYATYNPVPVTTKTLYDLASLTKVIATTSAIAQLIERKSLHFTDRVVRYIPQFGNDQQKTTITIQHLLTHTSGLPGPCRLYKHYHGANQILAGLCQQNLVFPPGTQCLYNDLGFILLGEIVRCITSLRLDEYTQQHIFGPLGMGDTLFTPPETLKARIAPTEYVEGRGGLVHGTVHDENAWEMEGIAGHAGLFSTVEDLARFCTMILQRGTCGPIKVFHPSTLAMMEAVQVEDPAESHGSGWIINAPYFMGQLASKSTFGHTGFTGTSIIINPEQQLAVVFLSNCVCPKRGTNLNPYRRSITNALALLYQR